MHKSPFTYVTDVSPFITVNFPLMRKQFWDGAKVQVADIADKRSFSRVQTLVPPQVRHSLEPSVTYLTDERQFTSVNTLMFLKI